MKILYLKQFMYSNYSFVYEGNKIFHRTSAFICRLQQQVQNPIGDNTNVLVE